MSYLRRSEQAMQAMKKWGMWPHIVGTNGKGEIIWNVSIWKFDRLSQEVRDRFAKAILTKYRDPVDVILEAEEYLEGRRLFGVLNPNAPSA